MWKIWERKNESLRKEQEERKIGKEIWNGKRKMQKVKKTGMAIENGGKENRE